MQRSLSNPKKKARNAFGFGGFVEITGLILSFGGGHNEGSPLHHERISSHVCMLGNGFVP